jgi:porin
MKIFSAMPAVTLALALCAVAGLPSLSSAESESAAAQPPAPWDGDIGTRDRLTGGWGGLRSDLADHGVDLKLRLSQYFQGVTSGGVDTNSEYGGTVDYIVNVDGHKLGLWEGLGFNLHATTRFGKDILADAGTFVLPNAGLMYPLPGDYHGTDITGLLVSQMLFDGKAQVLAGKLHALDLVTGMFPHQVDSGQEGFWNANSMLSISPWMRWINLSMYGAAAWTIKDGLAQTGVMVIGQENLTTGWGSWDDSFGDGPGVLLFHRFMFEIDDKPGYVYVGGGGSFKDYASTDRQDWLEIPGEGLVDSKKKKPWGVAVYWSQVFWQAPGNDKRFAQFFLGGAVGDDNPSFSDWDLYASVQAFGPFASRQHDRMGIAAWYNHLADDYVDLASSVPGISLRDDSYGLELYYNAEIIPSVHLTPNLQFAQNATKGDDIAVIPGLRLVIDF